MQIDRSVMLEYVLLHLGHHVMIDEPMAHDLRDPKKIMFPASDAITQVNDPLMVDGVPVLFSVGSEQKHHSVEGGQLRFHHDLIRSAFYLLSGQQELEVTERDSMGRFPYERSIQKRLGITTKPVVNYYFAAIINGLEELYGSVERRTNFAPFALALSHDIDVVDSYDLYSLGHKVKQLLRMASKQRTFMQQLDIIARHAWRWAFSKKNPAWSFDKLIRSAEQRGFRSTFFFLPKDQLHVDSYYNFTDQRIKDVMQQLDVAGFEVGLHGTVRSATSPVSMKKITEDLSNVTSSSTFGIRQHRLAINYPTTLAHQQAAGLKYDATLGFAEHEGFRNSYCHPFRPFDFVAQKMMDHWCVPLNVMDVTLLHYRALEHKDVLPAIGVLINEVKKFNGALSVLWHNDKLDDEERPGINSLYTQILDQLKANSAEGLTSMDLVKRIEAS